MLLKKILTSFSFCLLMYLPNQLTSSPSLSAKNSSTTIHHAQSLALKEEESELSYLDVLENYYDLAVGDASEPSGSFKDFCDDFYSPESPRDLLGFTLEFARENNRYDEVYSWLYGDEEPGIATFSSRGDDLGGGVNKTDARYILLDSSSYLSTSKSCFARKPIYLDEYLYSLIKPGDIIYETDVNIEITGGHDALVVDCQHDSEYGKYFQTIEAVGGGVQRGFLDDFRMAYYQCIILRVVGWTEEAAYDAVFFVNGQLGKPYMIDLSSLKTGYLTASWYCSQLVYAAWKYAGIDIGVKKADDGSDYYVENACYPADIYYSYNTTTLAATTLDFLSLSIESKSWITWKIRITNNCSYAVNVEYNSKMAFPGDFENWTENQTKLANITSISLSAHSSTVVDIKENLFATSIGASFKVDCAKGNFRFVTYADSLNNSTKTLDQHKIIIDENDK